MRKYELLKLQTDDVQDLGVKFLITVRGSHKTHSNRIFTIIDNEKRTLLNLIKHYISLRPERTPHKRFFIYYKKGRCSTQPIGINSFSKIPSLIARYLKLEQPHLYTGHCFRRSSASIVSESGADVSSFMRLGGRKSTAEEEGYFGNLAQNKVHTATETVTQACRTVSTPPHARNIQSSEVIFFHLPAHYEVVLTKRMIFYQNGRCFTRPNEFFFYCLQTSKPLEIFLPHFSSEESEKPRKKTVDGIKEQTVVVL